MFPVRVVPVLAGCHHEGPSLMLGQAGVPVVEHPYEPPLKMLSVPRFCQVVVGLAALELGRFAG
jgi:hypothetical protein